MDENEWLTATKAQRLLSFLHRRSTERKRRLFAVACCHRVWHLLTDPRCRSGLETAERFADGLVTRDKLGTAEAAAQDGYEALRQAGDEAGRWAADAVYAATCAGVKWDIADVAADSVASAISRAAPRIRGGAKSVERAAQMRLLRCIFGNPFRHLTIDPSWLTPTATALAAQMYESRDFSLMPILADALQDAGCEDVEVLRHCRGGEGTHVRGCWVVDLVLGKI